MALKPAMHGRDHCPGGSDEIPCWPSSSITCLRALKDYGSGNSIGTASEQPILYDDWENEDSSIFGETLSGGDLQKVSFKAQGVYTVTITMLWESAFDGVTEICWLDDSNTTGNWPFGRTGNMGQFGEGRFSDSFVYPQTLSITKKYPLYTMTSGDVTGGVYGQVFTKVIQRSGSNQDLTSVMLDIFYHGATQTSL